MVGMQELMDAMAVATRATRSEYHLTLGLLIDWIGHDTHDKSVPVLFDHSNLSPGPLHSYRGYYDDLSFVPKTDFISAESLLAVCVAALGTTFTGWKGGEFLMDASTPLWQANSGEEGSPIVDIRTLEGEKIILITKMNQFRF